MQRTSQLLKAASPLKIVEFDDGVAVFNPLSWDTHLLNDSAATVLEFLMHAARTEDEVTALLAEMLDEESRSDAARHARSVLGELSHLRLITEASI